MTEPRIDAPQTTLRYTCPFPGCSRSFRDFWRLKVHYRAAPGARGSGVERGHGMELPFCPLCNLDLRDVKYHKCAAGPAACAPAARSRNNQAAGNSMIQRQMQTMPGQQGAPYMMPQNGMMPYHPHHHNNVPSPYGYPANSHMPGTHSSLPQQPAHNQLLPGLPLLSQGSGHMQQQLPGQQQPQHLQRSASAPNPRSISTGTMSMPIMQPSAAVGQPMGKQWWQQQGQMQQLPLPPPPQQQQQLVTQMPAAAAPSNGNSSSMQLPLQQQQQQQQYIQMPQQQQEQQQVPQPGLPRMSNGSGQMSTVGMMYKPTPLMGMPSGDMGMHRQQSWQQPAWQQQQQQLGQTAGAHAMQSNTMSPFVGSQMNPPQQQQQQQQHMQLQLQLTHSGSAAAAAATPAPNHGLHNSSSWMQSSGYNTAAAADSGQVPPTGTFQPCTMSTNSSIVSYEPASANTGSAVNGMTTQQQQQQQQLVQLSAPSHSPVIAVGPELAAAAPSAAVALQQLPLYASKIIEDFRTELHSLRSTGSGSTGGTAAECHAGGTAGGGTAVQANRGNSSSCSNSPVSSSGITAADGRAVVVGVKRSLSDALGPDGTTCGSSGGPVKRQVTDTPPPSEAQEALLQLAAHAESEAADVQGLNRLQNPSISPGGGFPGVPAAMSRSPDGGYQPDDAHAAQVSNLLGIALEAANKCMQDPAPVVQQLLSVLDEHVSIVMAKHQHSQQQQQAAGPAVASPTAAAAAGSQQPADPFATAAAPHGPVVTADAAAVTAAAAAEAAASGQHTPAELDSNQQQQSAAAATGAFTPNDWYPMIAPLQQQQEQQLLLQSSSRTQHDGGSSSSHDQRSSPTVLDTLHHFHALQQQPICIPRSVAAGSATMRPTQGNIAPPPLPPLPPAAVKSLAQQQQQQQCVLTAAVGAAGSGSLNSTATAADAATAAAAAAEDEVVGTGVEVSGDAHDALAATKALQYTTGGLGFEPGTSQTPVPSPQQVSV